MNSGSSSFWSSGSVPLIEPEFLSSIIAAASDIALVVSSDEKILSVLISEHNDAHGSLEHWEGKSVKDVLTDESYPKFVAAMADFTKGLPSKRLTELNHSDEKVSDFPIKYTFHKMAHNDTVLLLGRDLKPIAETQQQLVQAQIALEKGYEARREYDVRYRVLLSSTTDAMLFVSVSDGRVKDANSAAAAMLGLSKDALIGSALSQSFEDRSTEELTESLMNAAMAEAAAAVALQSKSGRKDVTVTPSVFRAAGQRMLICRLSSDVPSQVAPELMGPNLLSLFREGSDAMLFTDAKGSIVATNDSFLDLLDAAHVGDVKGRSLAEFLSRGQIDLGVLVDNSKQRGQMGVYTTKLVNDLGGRIPVEISATYLDDLTQPAIGFVLRDSSRAEAMRQPTTTQMPTEESSQSVMELVGSATLKEIVAETTDVVEKMCIETAVSLTKNNRVAAAEMLGLSRQSLYVKLRKYGLLAKD
jgi:transcriptional regulator PpsR